MAVSPFSVHWHWQFQLVGSVAHDNQQIWLSSTHTYTTHFSNGTQELLTSVFKIESNGEHMFLSQCEITYHGVDPSAMSQLVVVQWGLRTPFEKQFIRWNRRGTYVASGKDKNALVFTSARVFCRFCSLFNVQSTANCRMKHPIIDLRIAPLSAHQSSVWILSIINSPYRKLIVTTHRVLDIPIELRIKSHLICPALHDRFQSSFATIAWEIAIEQYEY